MAMVTASDATPMDSSALSSAPTGEELCRLLRCRPDGRAGDFELRLPEGGGALRTLVGSRHRHSIAWNRDPQRPGGNPTDGVTERELSRYLTVHPDAVDHQTQPLGISATVDGIPKLWLADYWCLFRDGVFEIGEVKIDRRQIDDEYLRKMERMAEIVDGRLGCRFRIRYRRDIVGGEDRQHNVGMLHVDRGAAYEPHHLTRLQALEGEAGLSFGGVAEEVEPDRPHRAAAIVRRMICMGRVWTDLDMLLTEDSPVTVRGPATLRSPLRLQ